MSDGRLFGRERDLEALIAALAAGPLVTVVGPGGMGKTRLARALGEARPGAALLISLEACADEADICAAVAVALSAHGAPAASATAEAVGVALARASISTLILDNFDTLVPWAAATVARWLDRGPAVLVTSRSPLRLKREQVYALGPLTVEAGALALFNARARDHRRDFDAEADPEAAAALVQALDGIPLAIELAAALVDWMTPRAILARLDQRLDLLEGGAADAPRRHRTLRAAIAGSVAQLDEVAQAIMAWCAIFEGGWTLAAAEALLTARGLSAVQVFRGTRALRAVSLVQAEAGRLSFYDSVRAYALEMLTELGEVTAAQAAHRALYGGLYGGAPPTDVVEIAAEAANLTAVSRDEAAPPLARIRVNVALCDLYLSRGPLSLIEPLEAQALAWASAWAAVWASGGLEAAGRSPLIELLLRCGRHRVITGAAAQAEACVEAARALDEGAAYEGAALVLSGSAARLRGQVEAAEGLYLAALAALTPADPRRRQVLGHLGALYFEAGDAAAALPCFDEALAAAEAAGDEVALGELLTNRALVAQAAGDLEAAEAGLRRALPIHRRQGRRRYEGITLGDLGALALESGRWAEAHHAAAGAAILARMGDLQHAALYTAVASAGAALLGEAAAAPAVSGPAQSGADPLAVAAALYGEVTRLTEGLARWAAGDERPEQTDEAVEAALAAAAPWGERSDEVRLAIRVVGAIRAALAGREAALVVTRGGRLRPPGGPWRDLSARPVLVGLIWALAQDRLRGQGGLDRAGLLAAGWPGERMAPEAGVNRVHVALSTLRRHGLKAILRQSEGRYWLEAPVLCVGHQQISPMGIPTL